MLEIWVIKMLGPSYKTTLQGMVVTVMGLIVTALGFGIETVGQFFHSFSLLKFDLAILGSFVPTGLGLMQKDAGSQEAVVPGVGKTTVPSHETPNDPAAIPVK